MSRIKQTFSFLKEQNKQAMVAYLVAGVPDVDSTISIMHLMVTKGVDILELGVAFSDPMSEGPLIQEAHERALSTNITLDKILNIVNEFRKDDKSTPVVLMGYMNPFEAAGAKEFCRKASKSGVDGILVVDMPFEESTEFSYAAQKNNLDVIRLIAPTTNEKRMKKICKNASGYIYYISLKGITGATSFDAKDVKSKVNVLRRITNLPVVVGFGIKDGLMIQAVKYAADGIVVGSVLVEIISKQQDKIELELSEKLEELTSALQKE